MSSDYTNIALCNGFLILSSAVRLPELQAVFSLCSNLYLVGSAPETLSKYSISFLLSVHARMFSLSFVSGREPGLLFNFCVQLLYFSFTLLRAPRGVATCSRVWMLELNSSSFKSDPLSLWSWHVEEAMLTWNSGCSILLFFLPVPPTSSPSQAVTSHIPRVSKSCCMSFL